MAPDPDPDGPDLRTPAIYLGLTYVASHFVDDRTVAGVRPGGTVLSLSALLADGTLRQRGSGSVSTWCG